MLPEKVEAYYVDEIQEDGDAVGDDVNQVNDALWHLVDDCSRRETIVKDEWQVKPHDNGQIEAHSTKIKTKRIQERELVEKMQVEQIDQPTTDT